MRPYYRVLRTIEVILAGSFILLILTNVYHLGKYRGVSEGYEAGYESGVSVICFATVIAGDPLPEYLQTECEKHYREWNVR